jgi:hypothetical protein
MNQITKLRITFTPVINVLNRFAFSVAAIVLLAGSASPTITAFADAPAPTDTSASPASPVTSSTAPAATSTAPTTAATTTTTDPTPAPTQPSTPPAQPAAPTNTGPTTQPGPAAPTGPDASTYTYNATTGLWENQYYTWNPNTGQTSPRTPPTYSYNPATGMWDTTQWRYDAASGTYVPNVVAVTAPPVGAQTTSPVIASNPGSGAMTTTPSAIPLTAVANTSGINGNTGITLSSSSGNNTIFDNFYNAAISNHLNSIALSGNAIVTGNTTAGSAGSGAANDNANILNMLQSTASLLGNNAATFVSNIYGDVQGDILINPTNMSQPATDATSVAGNFKLNSQNSGQINNDINLAAASGDATVSKNTSGGNATTGNATAVANVVNLLNSMVTANQSFLGVVNIYGNLTGNIVVPQEFLDQLLATNAPTTTIDASAINQFSSTANNNQSINNNVTTNATSGSAAVSGNTTAGSATTGTAANKVTVFNLTGSQFIGADTMLVFVNVMGQWVGVMMNAPSGTTAAAYGSGVASNTVATAVSKADVQVTNNQSINNNITANAQSGNANVTGNTRGGNAQSGNASTAVNLLNLTNDQFSLSHWFGVLFINVFGNWYGNFGVSKPVVPTAVASGGSGGAPVTDAGIKMFQFVPSTSGNGTTTSATTTTPTTPTSGEFQLAHTKLTKELKALAPKATTTPPSTTGQSDQLFQIIGGAVFFSGLSLFGIEQYMKRRVTKSS